MVTREDTAMVRTIERTLGGTLERRELKDFDYEKAAPERQNRPARPIRKPVNTSSKPADKEKISKPSGAKELNRRRRPHRPAQTCSNAAAAR
jgi:hypothetical protein